MRLGFLYALVIAVVVALVAAAGEVSLKSSSCMACHTQEASYAHWMTQRLKAENRGFSHELIACADCHIEGSPAGTVTSRLRGLLHVGTYLVPQIDPRRQDIAEVYPRARIPTENCNYCHQAAVVRKAVHVKDLTPELKKIGLIMDHRKHVLTQEGTCAKCHERYKEKDGVSEVDKNVNYVEVNHMACDSCHSQASHAYRAGRLLPLSEDEYRAAREEAWTRLSKNPRWMVAIPAEQTCRRCHNGEIHFKTRIFPANCREGTNFEDCKKCHGLMTPQYFEEHRTKMTQQASVEEQALKGVPAHAIAARSE
jgi:DNA-directed RNA polymerase subunit M/transcription elongation factor TFIIS